jgi:hypothetical protein
MGCFDSESVVSVRELNAGTPFSASEFVISVSVDPVECDLDCHAPSRVGDGDGGFAEDTSQPFTRGSWEVFGETLCIRLKECTVQPWGPLAGFERSARFASSGGGPFAEG